MLPPATKAVALTAAWRQWFAATALPFWREHGFQTSNLAHERLHLDGRPDLAAPLRVRTQARQVYSFAKAARLGLDVAGGDRALATLWALRAKAWSPDGRPGWVHVLHPDGCVADDRRDLYDHAFILLMLASVAEVTDETFVESWIDATVDEIDVLFASSHGGYAETDRGGLPRRQNPHMHLFEAFLALHEATGKARFLARAAELFGLFRTRFLDEPRSLLREVFTADWQALAEEQGGYLEPGHFAEWVWLLQRYERFSGRPTGRVRERLLDAAERLGRPDAANGFLVDEVDSSAAPRQNSRRLWPQTEYLKALIVQARAADVRHWETASTFSDWLFRTYLAADPRGTWRDRFTIAGHPLGDHVPASTLYHLIGVIEQLQPEQSRSHPT